MRAYSACLAATITSLTSVATAQQCPSATGWAASEDDGIRYGRAVDFNGTFAAIGDYSADAYTGAVHLHRWDGTSWSPPQTINGVFPAGEFGGDVQLSGDWMAIAASEAGDGVVELWHFDGDTWQYDEFYQPPVEHRLLRCALDWPRLIVMEASPEGIAYLYCVNYNEDLGDWVKDPAILSTFNDDFSRTELALDDDQLTVALPRYSQAGFTSCGLVWGYQHNGESWELQSSYSFHWDNAAAGQHLSLDNHVNAWACNGYYMTGRAIDTASVVVAERHDARWTRLDITFPGESPWSQPGSQINDIAVDGDDMVVVLWLDDQESGVNTWSSHHLHREGDAFVYQGELELPSHTTSSLDPGAPRYVAAISDGFVLFDAGIADTERIVFAIPLNDCDGSGRADDCELDADGADTNADDVLDRCGCPGDINHDGTRDGDDLMAFLTYLGAITAHGDLDGDGATDIRDLVNLLRHWGDCD